MSPDIIYHKEERREDHPVIVKFDPADESGFSIEDLGSEGWRLGFTKRSQVDDFLESLSSQMPRESTQEEQQKDIEYIKEAIAYTLGRRAHFNNLFKSDEPDDLRELQRRTFSIRFSPSELAGIAIVPNKGSGFDEYCRYKLRFTDRKVVKDTYLLLLPETKESLHGVKNTSSVLCALGLPDIDRLPEIKNLCSRW